MSRLSGGVREALAAGASLASHVPGFVARPAQQRLAMAIADAFEQRGVLLAEAGTGTGKTFAYLVPALAVGAEDHHLHRHPRAAGPALPPRPAAGARRARAWAQDRPAEGPRQLSVPLPDGAGQGRAAAVQGGFASRAGASQFQRIVAWSGRTRMGDMAELEALPEDSPLLPMVTSTADNCLGSECPFWERLLRGAGAPARAGRRRGGGQPPPAAGRPGAQAGRLRRDPARRAGLRGRRGAPAARTGRAILRRRARRAAAGGTGARRLANARTCPARWPRCRSPRARWKQATARPARGDGGAAAARHPLARAGHGRRGSRCFDRWPMRWTCSSARWRRCAKPRRALMPATLRAQDSQARLRRWMEAGNGGQAIADVRSRRRGRSWP